MGSIEFSGAKFQFRLELPDEIPIVEPHRSEDPGLVFIHGEGPSRHAHDNLFDAIFGCALRDQGILQTALRPTARPE